MPRPGKLTPNDPPFATLHAAPRPASSGVPSERPLRLRQRRGRHDDHGVQLRRRARRLTSCTTSRRCPRARTGERLSTAQILVEPTGQFVYVSNRGHDTHRHLRHRPADRAADGGGPRANPGPDAAQLRHRPERYVPVRRQPEQRHDRPVPHRPARPASSTPTGDVTPVGGAGLHPVRGR